MPCFPPSNILLVPQHRVLLDLLLLLLGQVSRNRMA